jgi:hypothetical protein
MSETAQDDEYWKTYRDQNQKDSKQIRVKYGIEPWWKEEQRYESYQTPWPNVLVHEDDGEQYGRVGGTNCLALGGKGSGKSTLALYASIRSMEINDEAVIWRGSSSRSEWLPLRHWTTLLLPAGADVDARWLPRDIRAESGGKPADLEDVVRSVEYYDGLRDLLEKLESHQFHVVYPDPSFTGCNDVMADSDYCQQDVEYVPQAAAHADPDLDGSPLIHWWFAFCVARVEYGPYDWTTLVFDELGDWAPDDARADKHNTYEQVDALRRVIADSRKFYFSLYLFAHHRENLQEKIRRTIEWYVSMPDGTANPCQANNSTPPLGFEQVPMKYDMLSDQSAGRAICYTESSFTPFAWDDISDENDLSRWLKIQLADSGSATSRGHARATDGHGPARGGERR